MVIPSKAYLNNKRSSVFHKAFESQQLQDFKAPEYPKSPEQTAQLEELYTHSFLTKTLDPKQHTVLAKAMYSRKYKKGEVIIKYGDMGTDYFVLTQGKV